MPTQDELFTMYKDLVDRLARYRSECQAEYNQLNLWAARMEERLVRYDDFIRRTEGGQQRIPALLIAAISAASGGIAILVQIWLSRGP